MAVATALFVFSILASLYAWVGYPALLHLRSRRGKRGIWPRDIEPSVTVIIPVHNRKSQIAAKIGNTLALDYPADRLEVLVVSDGSTDGTDALVEAWPDSRVRLISLPTSGRLVALQQGGRRARGEVLLFTDVNASIDRGALRHLVRPLADRSISGVCGARKVRRSGPHDSGLLGAVLLARFEDRLKRLESGLGSIYAADTSLCAVRRSAFVPATNPAQADDIAISARVVLSGGRLIYEPRAVCRRPAEADSTFEFRKHMQIANYSIRALLDIRRDLGLRRSYGWQLMSHTVARDAVPIFLAIALFSSAFLSSASFVFGVILGIQVLFHSLAYFGWRLRRVRFGRSPVLALPFFFVAINGAGLLGMLGVIGGIRPVGAAPRRAPARRSA
jgi:cellulose synthase/poly-beta-1,6-N-acetylglucosamine synthase-like glycosyltransferase